MRDPLQRQMLEPLEISLCLVGVLVGPYMLTVLPSSLLLCTVASKLALMFAFHLVVKME